MKRYPCEETTLDMPVGPYLVRLWITNDHGKAEAPELRELVRVKLREMLWTTPLEMAEWLALAEIPGLAAVQVREGEIGHMIYTEPFGE